MTRTAPPARADRARTRARAWGGAGARRVASTVAVTVASTVAKIAPHIGRMLSPFRPITPLGRGAVLAGVIACAVALAWDWVEFWAIAGVITALLLTAVPFVLGRSQYAVRVELASSHVTVGEPAVGRVIIRNIAARPSRAVRIELPVGAARAEFRIPRLGVGEEYDEIFAIPTQRRAVLTLGPVTSVRSDPAGMLRREVAWTEPTELYVHPRIAVLTNDTTGFLRDLEGLPTRDLADDDVSFHALREYTPGDDLRQVHWRSTARTGTLMIRQFEQTRRSHLLVALSTRTADYCDADEFELAVSIVGSIATSAIRDGKTVTVLTSTGRLASPTANQLLDRLSGIDLAESRGGLDQIARNTVKSAPGASVVAFVTGEPTPLSEIRGAALRVPATARSMCVRAHTSGALARRMVGDVVTVSVPDLDALRSGMRAVSA